MLILTRNFGQAFIIHNDFNVIAKVYILTRDDSDSPQIRLGIDAPESISIDREEIFNHKIKDQ